MGERVLLYADVNPGDSGGVQAVCGRLAASLNRAGHVAVQAWPHPAPGRAGDIHLPLPPLVWRHGYPAPRSLVESSRTLLRLARVLARLRPTVVNVHFVTAAAAYFLRLAPVFRYGVVLSAHGSDALRPEPEHAALLPQVLRRADAVTAVSSAVGARLAARAGIAAGQVHVIPNGVDDEFWTDAVRAPDGRTIVSIGRLDPVKGHDVLLRAFAHVLARVPAARLAIVGGGGGRAALEQLARELRVDEAVSFTGELDAAGVRARLAGASVFVLPSRSEGLPLALLEAMAVGVPVVATAVGGVPDVLAPGTGLLVQPEDAARLGSAIEHLLEDPDTASELARRARLRARDFSARVADARYEEVLVRAAR